ncbi:MAG: hypothetical protein RIB47_15435 [Cyclobacteriaceae bacterium]
MNKIDNFFKGKLLEHSSSPSNASWSKIEAGLAKKNNKAIWLRIAAALLVGGLSVSIWYASQDSNGSGQELSDNQIEATPEVKEEAMDERQNDFDRNRTNQVAVASAEDRNEVINEQEKEKESKSSAMRINESVTTSESLPPTENLIAMEIATPETLPEEVKLKTDTPKPVVIEYTLASIETPSSEKAEVLDIATRKTGIKKVLEIAGEVRSGESSLSSLRQAKNELFAFNFIKEKEERNNK